MSADTGAGSSGNATPMDSDSSRVRFKESLLFVLFDDMDAYLSLNAWMFSTSWSFVPDLMVAIS
jgi:hypothetical protein